MARQFGILLFLACGVKGLIPSSLVSSRARMHNRELLVVAAKRKKLFRKTEKPIEKSPVVEPVESPPPPPPIQVETPAVASPKEKTPTKRGIDVDPAVAVGSVVAALLLPSLSSRREAGVKRSLKAPSSPKATVKLQGKTGAAAKPAAKVTVVKPTPPQKKKTKRTTTKTPQNPSAQGRFPDIPRRKVEDVLPTRVAGSADDFVAKALVFTEDKLIEAFGPNMKEGVAAVTIVALLTVFGKAPDPAVKASMNVSPKVVREAAVQKKARKVPEPPSQAANTAVFSEVVAPVTTPTPSAPLPTPPVVLETDTQPVPAPTAVSPSPSPPSPTPPAAPAPASAPVVPSGTELWKSLADTTSASLLSLPAAERWAQQAADSTRTLSEVLKSSEAASSQAVEATSAQLKDAGVASVKTVSEALSGLGVSDAVSSAAKEVNEKAQQDPSKAPFVFAASITVVGALLASFNDAVAEAQPLREERRKRQILRVEAQRKEKAEQLAARKIAAADAKEQAAEAAAKKMADAKAKKEEAAAAAAARKEEAAAAAAAKKEEAAAAAAAKKEEAAAAAAAAAAAKKEEAAAAAAKKEEAAAAKKEEAAAAAAAAAAAKKEEAAAAAAKKEEATAAAAAAAAAAKKEEAAAAKKEEAAAAAAAEKEKDVSAAVAKEEEEKATAAAAAKKEEEAAAAAAAAAKDTKPPTPTPAASESSDGSVTLSGTEVATLAGGLLGAAVLGPVGFLLGGVAGALVASDDRSSEDK